MPQYIDAQGRSRELLIADRDLVVKDPILGFDRQIVAGAPVPPELQDGYEQQGGGKKDEPSQADQAKPPRSKRSSSAGAAADAGEDS
jgi:hypothetical protein